MQKYLITGCNGQLGLALQGLLKQDPEAVLVLTDVGGPDPEAYRPLDITDVDAVLAMAQETRPDIIINCAAFTAVDAAEEKPELCMKINALGPRNLAIAARAVGAKLVHISTDYVFPGTESAPRTEFDATGPISVYGKTKLAGENFVREFADRWFILRTAWLYGEGKNFVRTMLRLSETRDELTVVCDQFGSPTSADELARAVLALVPTENYGLYHATCEGSTDWASFAARIMELAGRKTTVRPVTSEEYQAMNPQSAPRPHYSILDNSMLRMTGVYTFKDWDAALQEYLEKELG